MISEGLEIVFANPKSIIFDTPFFIKILSGFKSLCTILFLYKCFKPYIIPKAIATLSKISDFFNFFSQCSVMI